jgi:hypothetical protein
MRRHVPITLLLVSIAASSARAQSARITRSVRDDSGGPLPGASIELRTNARAPQEVITDSNGGFLFDGLPVGKYELACRLINFATAR